MEWLKEKGCEWVKLCAEPGDLIVWDSRAPVSPLCRYHKLETQNSRDLALQRSTYVRTGANGYLHLLHARFRRYSRGPDQEEGCLRPPSGDDSLAQRKARWQ